MSAIFMLLVLISIVVLFFIFIYNRLIVLRNMYKNAFAQIDVQLKRRYDLIPNLVETAKAYLTHERTTLEAVISARNSASLACEKVSADPSNREAMKSLMGAESALGSSLGRLFALKEAYPELKANQNMAQLSEELTSTENKVSFARQAYNDSVMTYNISRETFPNVLVAEMLGFEPAVPFEIPSEAERVVPKVSFS